MQSNVHVCVYVCVFVSVYVLRRFIVFFCFLVYTTKRCVPVEKQLIVTINLVFLKQNLQEDSI